MSRAINYVLKNKETSKQGRSWLQYVDYTLDELKKHLQDQFEPWMSWNNWGKYNAKTWKDDNTLTWFWQIDHIVPSSTFDIKKPGDEEFKKCWALSNLRPLSAKQNWHDGVNKTRHLRGK